jgi:hypothetical protein
MKRKTNRATSHCQLCHEHLTNENRFVAGLCKRCRALRENGAEPVYSRNSDLRETAE